MTIDPETKMNPPIGILGLANANRNAPKPTAKQIAAITSFLLLRITIHHLRQVKLSIS